MPDGKTIAAMSLPIPENLTQYAGRDLEGMCFAENYHRWILRIFEPFLGTQLVEVGAGTGSFSELVLKGRIESLSLVEPSEEMYKILHSRINRGHRSVKSTSPTTRRSCASRTRLWTMAGVFSFLFPRFAGSMAAWISRLVTIGVTRGASSKANAYSQAFR